MRTSHNILRLLAAVSLMLVGIVGATSAASAAPAQAPAVTIVGDAHGLKPQSQHTNADGSVTSTWKNSVGQGFIYAGPNGARISISPTTTTVAGKTLHSLKLSVAPPGHAPGSAKAAVAAYAAAGRSVLNDALNAGVNPAVAKAKFGTGTKSVTPNSARGGNILTSWCVTPVTFGQYITASGCVTEYLVQASPEYISDDMEALGTTNASYAPVRGLAIWSDYRSGTVVPPWVPNGSQGTDCHDVTASASWGGFSFSSTSTICGGSYVTKLASNTFGMQWSGVSSGQVGLEPIDVVSIRNGDDYTYLNLQLGY